MNYIKITKNDIANGIGIGCVLWVAGCNCHCKNCHNQSTWDFNAGQLFSESTMQEILLTLTKPYISRITLSGGHPLDPHNLPEVYKIVKRVKSEFPNKDIWLYTGYEWESIVEKDRIMKNLKDDDISELDVIKLCDVVVDSKYVDELRDITLPYRGSSNQRIIDVQKSLEQNKVILWQE